MYKESEIRSTLLSIRQDIPYLIGKNEDAFLDKKEIDYVIKKLERIKRLIGD